MSANQGSGGFGPNPWQQTSWDWRAAGNFMGGGSGTGLLIVTALFAAPTTGDVWTANWLLLTGLALVGLGLLCVWLEIGRPLRALHVFFNPYTSWMSREGFVGLLLFPSGLLAIFLGGAWMWWVAVVAAAFLYCQSRMLPATKGIPAWRPRQLTTHIFATGLCEGCGLFLLLGPLHSGVSGSVLFAFVALVLLRMFIWTGYRRAVDGSLAARARDALNQAGSRMMTLGTIAPVALLVLAMAVPSRAAQAGLIAIAGAGAAFSGAYLKFILLTRASYNQGFALTNIPVRGVRANT